MFANGVQTKMVNGIEAATAVLYQLDWCCSYWLLLITKRSPLNSAASLPIQLGYNSTQRMVNLVESMLYRRSLHFFRTFGTFVAQNQFGYLMIKINRTEFMDHDPSIVMNPSKNHCLCLWTVKVDWWRSGEFGFSSGEFIWFVAYRSLDTYHMCSFIFHWFRFNQRKIDFIQFCKEQWEIFLHMKLLNEWRCNVKCPESMILFCEWPNCCLINFIVGLIQPNIECEVSYGWAKCHNVDHSQRVYWIIYDKCLFIPQLVYENWCKITDFSLVFKMAARVVSRSYSAGILKNSNRIAVQKVNMQF